MACSLCSYRGNKLVWLVQKLLGDLETFGELANDVL